MRKVPFLLRRCDLPGCERPGAFELSDSRAICALHGLLFMAGDSRVEATRPEPEPEPGFEDPDP